MEKPPSPLRAALDSLRDHDRKVPLLRGRVHVFNFAIHCYSLFVLSRKSLDAPTKLAYAISMAISIANTVVAACYHNNVLDLESRSVFKRVDYAVIFLTIATAYFPIYVHLIRDDFTFAYVFFHWALIFAGVFGSLVFDFCGASKWFRVVVFLACGTSNHYILYQLYRLGHMAAVRDYVVGNVAYTLGSFCYAAKRPNLVPRIFEHHELMHLLVVVGNYFTFGCNFKVV